MKVTGKYFRTIARLAAVAVIGVTSVVLVNAAQTVVIANAANIPYNLAAGATSAAISLTADRPILAMGICTTVGVRGVGQVTLLRTSVAPFFIEWTGLESTAGSAITQGFSDITGTHIVYLDFAHQVELEVVASAGATPTRMSVHNGAGAARVGHVTLIW